MDPRGPQTELKLVVFRYANDGRCIYSFALKDIQTNEILTLYP